MEPWIDEAGSVRYQSADVWKSIFSSTIMTVDMFHFDVLLNLSCTISTI